MNEPYKIKPFLIPVTLQEWIAAKSEADEEIDALRTQLAAAREEIRVLKLHSSAIKLNEDQMFVRTEIWPSPRKPLSSASVVHPPHSNERGTDESRADALESQLTAARKALRRPGSGVLDDMVVAEANKALAAITRPPEPEEKES